MPHWLQRTLVLAYLALLVLALLPRHLRALGPVGDGARAVLASVGVVPGISVFRGYDNVFRLHFECLSVEGRTPEGEILSLYTMKCPPLGAHWRHGGFDHLMQQLIRNTRTRDIAEEARRGRTSPDLWRLLVVGDYFCHSPLASAQEREQVTLHRTQYQSLYATHTLFTHDTRCTWVCLPDQASPPECTPDRNRRRLQPETALTEGRAE